MDKDTGIWLVHSVPKFVSNFTSKDGYKYPDSGDKNGQTLLCISFDTKTEGKKVADQLSYMRPNVSSNEWQSKRLLIDNALPRPATCRPTK